MFPKGTTDQFFPGLGLVFFEISSSAIFVISSKICLFSREDPCLIFFWFGTRIFFQISSSAIIVISSKICLFPRGPLIKFFLDSDIFFFFRFHHQQLLSQVRFACFLGGPLIKFFLGWELYSFSDFIISNYYYLK